MKCRKCGAELLDTDTFCVKCGQKIDQQMFCPNCGEHLREGERFCHKCGTKVEAVEEDEAIPVSVQNTIDIPFDQIEQGILLEAEKTARAEQRELERRELERRELERRELERREFERRALEQREFERRKPEQRESAYERDFDEENEGGSGMKIMMVVMGIAIVAVALVIGYIFWQKTNSQGAGNEVEQGSEADGEAGQGNSADTVGRIQILEAVNVRNKPTTDGSEVMMVAKTGETYEYYELVDESWYRIKLEDGREGYVSAKYVEDLQ